MKYLKKYNSFKENFEILDTDEPDLKMAKEKMNDLKNKLSDYKSKKSSLEQLYKSDEVKDSDLEKIVGKDDKNPFLISYANILSTERKIRNLKEKENKKSVELSEFKDRLNDSDGEAKESLSNKVSDIENQIKDIKNKISEINKNIPEIEEKHKEKIENLETDIKKWIDKIQ